MNQGPKYYIYGYTPYGDDGWQHSTYSLEELQTLNLEEVISVTYSHAWIYKVENNTLYHAGSWSREAGLALTEPEEVSK